MISTEVTEITKVGRRNWEFHGGAGERGAMKGENRSECENLGFNTTSHTELRTGSGIPAFLFPRDPRAPVEIRLRSFFDLGVLRVLRGAKVLGTRSLGSLRRVDL